MNLKVYIDKFENNKFDFDLRVNLSFNDEEYNELINILKDLEGEIKKYENIPINLALNLYYIPYVVRNTLNFLRNNRLNSELIQKVEDAWIEIDNLVLTCLSINQ